ncbi:unnamed protein product [Malus baccata var. baccata]
MTRSSHPVRENILDFDDDFERELRRKRKNPEPSESSSNSEAESEFEEEEPAARPAATQGKTKEFELKSSLLHHIPKYHGLSMEDPNKHLKEFKVVCSSMTPINVDGSILKMNPNKHLKEFKVVCSSMTPINVDGSILKMKAFPFSLLEKVKDWLYELAPGTVSSWESMKRAFLEKFFPTSQIILLRKRISGIQQDEGGRALVDKNPTAAKTLIANRALNAQQYEGVGQRSTPRQHQVNEVSAISELQNQMANLTTLLSQVVEGPKVQNVATCGVCSMDKKVDELEKQVGQIAEFIGQFREQGKLPSLTVVNPMGGFESAKAMSLRSGKQVGSDPQPSKSRSNEVEELIIEEEEQGMPTTRIEAPLSQPPKQSNSANKGKEVPIVINSNVVPPNVPFPCRFMQSKKDEVEKDILETFRKVQVNIPILDAIKQVPRYAKFLKELCTTRKRISTKEVVKVGENVSAILQRKLPLKCKDPSSFTIPCVIGNTRFESAMLDLGASINVMPYSIYASMNLEELKNDGVIIQLADRSNAYPKGVLEDVLVQVNHLIFPADFYVLEMDESDHAPSLPILLGRPFMKTAWTKIDVFNGTLTMEFDGEVINFNLSDSMKYPSDNHSCFAVDVIDSLAHDHFDKLNDDALELVIARGMDMQNIEVVTMHTHDMHEFSLAVPLIDDVIEMVATLESLPPQSGKFLDPILSLVSANKMPPSVVQPPTLELKPLPSHLKYVFLGDDETLLVIISSSLTAQEEDKLVRVLKEYKTSIGWTLADIKGISPTTCMHRILLEKGSKISLEAQCRLNCPMMEVVQKEIIKFFYCGVIYPISDSRWVSPVQCVPKKSGVTVVANVENELAPTRIQTGWRVCIDYRKLNATTRKDHFPLPFIDQMLERLAGYAFYCFIDGYSGYNQIVIAPEDQEKTTFTCPFGTFAYRRMPFGLCNAPATFQRCMMSIFSYYVEKIIEVFMDDFSVFGDSFDGCLHNLSLILKRCVETNLVLNWEKCHFMVKQGIVLGHIISENGIEVDKSKIDLVRHLPSSTSVREVRFFLGHAGFYRRFIKDFSKVAQPLCRLLQKDVVFDFNGEYTTSFNQLKELLTTAPIIVPPDWSLPFELMCDASDYALGAILGQRKDKRPHVIYYASWTLNDAQLNYSTTEKELLAVVFALDKFRSYLIGTKVIVFTDHAALKYLLTKKEAKPWLIRWMLLLQEFDIEIRDKKGSENVVVDHLSRMVHNEESLPIAETFPAEQLLS